MQNQEKKLLDKRKNKCAASCSIEAALLNVGKLFKQNYINLEQKKFSAWHAEFLHVQAKQSQLPISYQAGAKLAPEDIQPLITGSRSCHRKAFHLIQMLIFPQNVFVNIIFSCFTNCLL